VRQHPDWFARRPDGTIRFAENPPKKYQDIVPFDFASADREALWRELRDVVLLWVDRGVRTFRVDNPHTKPIPFWEWLIGEVKERHPDAVFLSEAFTKAKVMKALAKAGFTQSYTYFTWRTGKHELEDYMKELTRSKMKEYFRGNLWPNTPDILPEILQRGGPPAFRMRLVLAATLSSVYGIYSGYELCENEAVPGTEEYRHSEKYELKARDWTAPGNITEFITTLNLIRRAHPALHLYDNLRFHRAEDDRVLFYGKATPGGEDALLVAVSLDPFEPREAVLHVPIEQFGIGEKESYEVEDLLTGARRVFVGRRNAYRLDPETNVAAVLAVYRFAGRETSFDYY
jgi:starch synthase (maltosyl-transferring)